MAVCSSSVASGNVIFSSCAALDEAVFSALVALDKVVFSEGSLGRDFRCGFFWLMGERPRAGFSLGTFSSKLRRPVPTLLLFPSVSEPFFRPSLGDLALVVGICFRVIKTLGPKKLQSNENHTYFFITGFSWWEKWQNPSAGEVHKSNTKNYKETRTTNIPKILQTKSVNAWWCHIADRESKKDHPIQH